MTLVQRVQGMEQVVALADAGSFVEAARRLGVSASAIGKAIAALEERLGVRLFQRTTRSVALTEEGALYLNHCRRVLAEVGDAEAATTERAGAISGVVRISTPLAYGRQRIVPELASFLAEHPAVRIDLRMSDHVIDPVEDRIDLLVRIGTLADSGMRAWPFDTIRLGAFASPRYLDTSPAISSPDDLARHRLLAFQTPEGRALPFHFAGWEGAFRDEQFVLVSTDADASVIAAAAGAGICFVPSFMATAAVADGALVPVLAERQIEHAPVHLVAPRPDRVPRRVVALVEHLRERT